MKLTVLAILLSFLGSLASQGYSQTTRLNLEAKDLNIEDFFRKIEDQSEYRFFYSGKIDVERTISGRFENKLITEVLDNVLKNTDIKYEMKGRQIILSPLETILSVEQQQQKSISGKVTDSSGASLPGVSVVVKGTTTGVITDMDGKYAIAKVPDNATLQFSFVGMKTQEIKVGTQNTINVVLSEESIGIEEVVAVGYGVQKKVNLTGSVDVISSDRLSNRQSPTVSQLLQGTSPSLNLAINNHNGFSPGAEMGMTIRGIGSLNGGKPYVIIDGVSGDINSLNPEDIKSISILKDAASSAIYGARAAYGVILVTTKSGKKNEKFSASYSGDVSFNKAARQQPFLDSYTWTRVQNEAGNNLGGRPISDYTMDLIIAYQNKDWDWIRNAIPGFPEDADVRYGSFPNGNKWDNAAKTFANTDWWDVYLKTAVNQKHDFSFQGGSKNASYYFSAGYLGQEGTLNFTTDIFERINVTGKVDISIADWWDFSYQTRLTRSNREYPNSTSQGDYDQLWRLLSRAYPFTPVYNGYGNYNMESDIPVLQAGTDRIEAINNWHLFKMEIRPLKGLKINGDFAYNTESKDRLDVEKNIPEQMVDKTVEIFGLSKPNNIERTLTDYRYWTANMYTGYEFSINKNHQFNFMVGMQLEKGITNQMSGYKTDMIVEAIPSFNTATGTSILSESLSHSATEGLFSRLNYNYKEKYLFESNVRYDGSYTFVTGNRWGFFPSFSLGWNAHKESFWNIPEKYISSLKFRGSWGSLGNQNIQPYSDLELMPISTQKLNWIFNYGNNRPIGYTQSPNLTNFGLTWETATTTNLGFDISFLNNKLLANFDLFQRLTTNMIGPAEAKPGVLGASVPNDNNSTLRTRGWELSLNWKDKLENGLSYFVTLNLSDATSVVTKYNNPTGILSTWHEGGEIGEIWGYTVHDLFRSQKEVDDYLATTQASFIASKFQPGDVRYEDINADGFVNNGKNTIGDHGDLSIIGNDQPHWQYGINAGFDYKGFDFSMTWNGVAKRDIYFDEATTLYWGFHSGWYNAQISNRHLDYFRDTPGTKYSGLYEGDANINLGGYFPKPYLNQTKEIQNKHFANTRYMTSAAYLRMQNVQIGYTLPQNIANKLSLQRLRIYLSGENLFTITKLPPGIDPLALYGFSIGGSQNGLGRGTYGADRSISLGLTLTY